jgi:hypothetical protein
MKHLNLTTSGLAVALFILIVPTILPSGLSGSALVQGGSGQDRSGDRGRQYDGSADVRQHGFEHAYREGADQGRQDRESGLRYNLKPTDVEYGARFSYQPYFGSRIEYMNGYREGYKAGYDDGYYERPGQYGQLYGRPNGDRWRNGGDSRGRSRGNDTYDTRSGGATDMAFDNGYRAGISAGQQDHGRNTRSNYRAGPNYQSADSGYRPGQGDRETYRLHFRDGFERGYQDGYGRSQFSSDGGGYYPTQPGRPGAVDTRDGQGPATKTIVIPGNQQWVPTGIRVNQGDVFRFQTTGEIKFSPNPNDRAASTGAIVSNKYLPGAPLPEVLAGAFIGRIDNGRPFGIGSQPSIMMPASGMLYLGINDGNVSDNSGEFKVNLSW